MANRMRLQDTGGAGLERGGWNMFSLGARAGAGLVCAAAVALMFSGSTLAQSKELSEKSVQMLMQYAWAITPPKYTPPDGKTIEVDKSKPKDVMVPLDVAREVVKVGYLSAHAQLCDLAEEQAANYQTLMKRQEAAKWSGPQLLYIQRLHQITVMIMTGKIVIVEKEGDKTIVEREAKTNITEQCTDVQRQRVKAQIATYIGAAAPPSKTAEPVKTGTQKK
jgi:hypothetical protein